MSMSVVAVVPHLRVSTFIILLWYSCCSTLSWFHQLSSCVLLRINVYYLFYPFSYHLPTYLPTHLPLSYIDPGARKSSFLSLTAALTAATATATTAPVAADVSADKIHTTPTTTTTTSTTTAATAATATTAATSALFKQRSLGEGYFGDKEERNAHLSETAVAFLDSLPNLSYLIH